MDRLDDLVRTAERQLKEGSLWHAYVSVESAILGAKLRYGLEHEELPVPPKRTSKKDELLAVAESRLSGIDFSGDKSKLLYDLRACRDALKAALAR